MNEKEKKDSASKKVDFIKAIEGVKQTKAFATYSKIMLVSVIIVAIPCLPAALYIGDILIGMYVDLSVKSVEIAKNVIKGAVFAVLMSPTIGALICVEKLVQRAILRQTPLTLLNKKGQYKRCSVDEVADHKEQLRMYVHKCPYIHILAAVIFSVAVPMLILSLVSWLGGYFEWWNSAYAARIEATSFGWVMTSLVLLLGYKVFDWLPGIGTVLDRLEKMALAEREAIGMEAPEGSEWIDTGEEDGEGVAATTLKTSDRDTASSVMKGEVKSSSGNTAQRARAVEISGLKKFVRVLLILSTIVMGLSIVPLLWCIPMLNSYTRKIKSGEPISTGFKIACLFFINMLAGILMFCDKD